MEVTFSLPYCLLLPDGDYQVEISEDDVVTLRLAEKLPDSYDERLGLRGLLKSDISGYEKVGALNVDSDYQGTRAKEFHVDEIMKVEEPLMIEYFTKGQTKVDPPGEFVLNQELPHDPFGRFRYTKVTFISENNSDLIQRAAAAINKLVISYRANTDSFWITPIREKDLEVYEAKGEKRFNGLTKFAPKVHEETVKQIRHELMTEIIEMPFHMLFLDAKYAYEQMNYTLCVIYSITSIEALVKSYLEMYSSRHKIKGVSKEGLLKTPIHNAVSVILRLLIPRDQLTDELISEFVVANRKRNNVIHKAKQDIGEADARKALHVAEALIGILVPKISDLLHEKIAEFNENRRKAS